jgi:hypothetical protein
LSFPSLCDTLRVCDLKLLPQNSNTFPIAPPTISDSAPVDDHQPVRRLFSSQPWVSNLYQQYIYINRPFSLKMTGISLSTSLWSGILLTALLWACAWGQPSIEMDYCATINTASGTANHSIYQSDGLCHDFCQDKYAIAIVKGDSCWCSNFVPDESVQVSVSECSKPCPGYNTDVCGGDTEYGYMLLARSPSGTVGATTKSTAAPTTSVVQPGASDHASVDVRCTANCAADRQGNGHLYPSK